jgi:hypothetical protein
MTYREFLEELENFTRLLDNRGYSLLDKEMVVVTQLGHKHQIVAVSKLAIVDQEMEERIQKQTDSISQGDVVALSYNLY